MFAVVLFAFRLFGQFGCSLSAFFFFVIAVDGDHVVHMLAKAEIGGGCGCLCS